MASPPAEGDWLRSRRLTAAACAAPGPYPPDWSRWNTYGTSGTGSSRTASRLASRARIVWKCRHVPSLSGLLPPPRATPRLGCPQLHQPAATDRRQGPFTPARLWWRLVAHPSPVPLGRRRPGSRHLHAGHRLASKRTPARLIPGSFGHPGFDVVVWFSTRQQWFTRVRLPGPHLTDHVRLFPNAHHDGRQPTQLGAV